MASHSAFRQGTWSSGRLFVHAAAGSVGLYADLDNGVALLELGCGVLPVLVSHPRA